MHDQQANGKREKFVELAEARTTKAVKAIKLVGNLSNRQYYEFDENDSEKIIAALKDAVADVEARMSPQGKKPEAVFRL